MPFKLSNAQELSSPSPWLNDNKYEDDDNDDAGWWRWSLGSQIWGKLGWVWWIKPHFQLPILKKFWNEKWEVSKREILKPVKIDIVWWIKCPTWEILIFNERWIYESDLIFVHTLSMNASGSGEMINFSSLVHIFESSCSRCGRSSLTGQVPLCAVIQL